MCLLCWHASTFANSFLKIDKFGKVAPVIIENKPLAEVIKQYANLKNIPVTYKEKLISKDDKVSLHLNHAVELKDFDEYFFYLLSQLGFSILNLSGEMNVVAHKDIRYLANPFYYSDQFPKTHNYITVSHRLKFPIGKSIDRILRPFFSRYGRLVLFGDESTLIFHEKGTNIDILLKIIETMDNNESYERYKKMKKTKKHKTEPDLSEIKHYSNNLQQSPEKRSK